MLKVVRETLDESGEHAPKVNNKGTRTTSLTSFWCPYNVFVDNFEDVYSVGKCRHYLTLHMHVEIRKLRL